MGFGNLFNPSAIAELAKRSREQQQENAKTQQQMALAGFIPKMETSPDPMRHLFAKPQDVSGYVPGPGHAATIAKDQRVWQAGESEKGRTHDADMQGSRFDFEGGWRGKELKQRQTEFAAQQGNTKRSLELQSGQLDLNKNQYNQAITQYEDAQDLRDLDRQLKQQQVDLNKVNIAKSGFTLVTAKDGKLLAFDLSKEGSPMKVVYNPFDTPEAKAQSARQMEAMVIELWSNDKGDPEDLIEELQKIRDLLQDDDIPDAAGAASSPATTPTNPTAEIAPDNSRPKRFSRATAPEDNYGAPSIASPFRWFNDQSLLNRYIKATGDTAPSIEKARQWESQREATN